MLKIRNSCYDTGMYRKQGKPPLPDFYAHVVLNTLGWEKAYEVTFESLSMDLPNLLLLKITK